MLGTKSVLTLVLLNTVWLLDIRSKTMLSSVWSMWSSWESCRMADMTTIPTNITMNNTVNINSKRALLFGSSETNTTLLCKAGIISSCLSMKMVISVGLNLLMETFLGNLESNEASDLLLDESADISLVSSSLYRCIYGDMLALLS